MPDEKVPSCRRSNITYKRTCRLCLAVGNHTVYIGESSRSLHERFNEHAEDIQKTPDTSHMATHLMTSHLNNWEEHVETGDPWKCFKVEIFKTHRTAFSRQIHEAVAIMREAGTLLNSQEEYNRCLGPTLDVEGRRLESNQQRQAREEVYREIRDTGERAELENHETNHKRGNTQHNSTHTQQRKKIKFLFL